ncbi:tRNA pseudouridine(13) synthase [hydrothermal vent metagenome]|uniref:tRNA pseudouridine(13) synthase n=1 Tax=hydrothermal vent metagenome TaxID=652676 RepID=A0A3B1BEJ4_9ZZZZ
MSISRIVSLPYAYSAPECSGVIRHCPEDFRVDEISGIEPDGEGEHVLLQIRKRNSNTEWLAKQLARLASVAAKDVSYAGMKDRQAVTTQWFSVRLAGRDEPDWNELNSDEFEVLQVHRHRRKLRRGTLKGNRFELLVRELSCEPAWLEARLENIKQQGVPNYFGEQRFGIDGSNLQQARAMFEGKRIKSRHQRSMYLSAARSQLFNHVLSQRVEQQNWNQAIPGDVMLLAGSNSFFVIDEVDNDIRQRVETFDIHPSGVLWGRGQTESKNEAAEREAELAQEFPLFCQGLEKAGLSQSRRALRVFPEKLEWTYRPEQKQLALSFQLPAGAYATVVLRELVSCV